MDEGWSENFTCQAVNIAPRNTAFYKDLFAFLGWNVLHEGEGMLGVGGANEVSFWFAAGANDARNDYDGPGVNHIGIGAPTISDVDATVDYLKAIAVPALFETPRHRPDFASSPDQTYYQVMFESPDRILFEVVYTGPK